MRHKWQCGLICCAMEKFASLKAAIDLIRRRGVANSAAAAVANLIKLVGIFFVSFSRCFACARQSTFCRGVIN